MALTGFATTEIAALYETADAEAEAAGADQLEREALRDLLALTAIQADALRALHDEMAEFGDLHYYVRGCFLRMWRNGHLRGLGRAEEREQVVALLDGLADLGLVRHLNGCTVPGLAVTGHALTSAGYRALGEAVPDVVTHHEAQVA